MFQETLLRDLAFFYRAFSKSLERGVSVPLIVNGLFLLMPNLYAKCHPSIFDYCCNALAQIFTRRMKNILPCEEGWFTRSGTGLGYKKAQYSSAVLLQANST